LLAFLNFGPNQWPRQDATIQANFTVSPTFPLLIVITVSGLQFKFSTIIYKKNSGDEGHVPGLATGPNEERYEVKKKKHQRCLFSPRSLVNRFNGLETFILSLIYKNPQYYPRSNFDVGVDGDICVNLEF
jgi:hypothetical protein